ncbi:MAG: DUF1987 domain-containing protein [Bacteroidota bacterium]
MRNSQLPADVTVKCLRKSKELQKYFYNLGETRNIMNALVKEKTHNTPYIHLDPNGEMYIEGRSILENPADFYQELLDWLDSYSAHLPSKTLLNIKLEYINSSSSKFITAILRYLSDYYQQGHESVVNWHYEKDDESIFELGQNYKNTMYFTINLISYTDHLS